MTQRLELKTTNIPNYLVVEGPIGVGKTSLAKRLAESFGSSLILEDPDNNPFLERFYQNPKQLALPVQLSFLFQRARQMETMRQSDLFTPVHVSDYLIEKDRLFARLNLDEDEYRLYEQVYAQLSIEAPVPDLVVYLQAPAETLQKRVVRRGDSRERDISTEYLAKLVDAYAEFFHRYSASPLLIVNAAEIDIVNSDEDYNLLLEYICESRAGRRYFNPIAKG